jgi:fructose-specific PTS system IIA-like component
MLEFDFPCPLIHGLHARPASLMQAAAQRHRSAITIENLRNQKVANVRSVFSLVGAEIQHQDPCRLQVRGPDEDQALRTLQSLLEQGLAAAEPAESMEAPAGEEVVLPHSLKIAEPVYVAGTPAVKALAWARLHVAFAGPLPEHVEVGPALDPSAEQARFDRARDSLAEQLRRRIQASGRSVEGQILSAHLAMLSDEEFIGRIHRSLAERGSAGQAILEAGRHYGRLLRSSEIAVVRERVLDLDDMCRQLLRQAYGPKVLPLETVALEGPSILAVDSLTPSAFLALDRENLVGLILGDTGMTSHTIILAKGRGLGTLTGVDVAPLKTRHGQEVVLDASLGICVLQPQEPVKAYYRLEQARYAERRARVQAAAGSKVVTRDGRGIEIGANISCSEEAAQAFAQGADGIGLLRTEMLFLGRDAPPDEQEQAAAYQEVLAAARGRPVIFRTVDLGGDKDAPYLALGEPEDNPLLGCRGIRLYKTHEYLFRTQVHALFEAAALQGESPWIMVPMVSSLEEVRWVKSVLNQIRAERTQARRPCPPILRLGAMVETPAAALIVDHLCPEFDFFSIGTNDLTQYLLAVDRTSGGSRGLYSGHHPAVLRALRHVVEEAHRRGKWVGVCGEMASDPVNLPLWLGLGVEEISVTAAEIGLLKTEAVGLSAEESRVLISGLMECPTPAEVGERLLGFRQRTRHALVDSRMIRMAVKASTKAAAIKALVDLLYVEGRTEEPAALENALWQRESSYSTGLGYGFAVPHCQSPALHADTIAILKLAEPIAWESLDGRPVSVVILLAMRKAGNKDHLQVLARLARSLVQESFRQLLLEADSPQQIAQFLEQRLRLSS